MKTNKIAKVVFDYTIGQEFLSSFVNPVDWEIPPDFHVTCAYLNKRNPRDDKVEVIDWCKQLIRENRNEVTIEFDGIYEGSGCIFSYVKTSNVIGDRYSRIPRPMDQILHLTLLVDRKHGHQPKESLLSLRYGNYTNIANFNKTFIGTLVVEDC